jgi:hypothetical protein
MTTKIKFRDASQTAITDHYIDVELKERAKSAKTKII